MGLMRIEIARPPKHMNKIAELDLCVVSTKRITMFLSTGNQAPDSRYDYLEKLTKGRSLRPTPEPKRSRNLPSRKTRNRSSKHGTVAVEVALCTPFLLFLIFTSFEFSRMMMIKQSITNAAREGCRLCTLATVSNSEDGIARVREQLRGVIADFEDENIVRVTVSPTFTSAPASGTEITVTIEIDGKDVSYLATGPFEGITIGGTATMSRE